MKFITLVNGCKEILTIMANFISYDNSVSGLAATDVKSALDELAAGTSDGSIDGGFANSVYTPEQCFDGGNA